MSVPFSAHITFRPQASMHNSLVASAFRRLYCAQFTSGFPQALSFSKSGMNWNSNRITINASISQTLYLVVLSDLG
jgi:hypothetical protein